MTESKSEVKCCDRNGKSRFCPDCGSRIVVPKGHAIPEYRRQLDQIIKFSQIIVCQKAMVRAAYRLTTTCDPWNNPIYEFHYRQVNHYGRVNVLEQNDIPHAFVKNRQMEFSAMVPPADSSRIETYACATVGDFICAMAQNLICEPWDGLSMDSLMGKSYDDAMKHFQETKEKKEFTVTIRPYPREEPEKYNHTGDMKASEKHSALVHAYRRQKYMNDLIDSIKIKLYYSPREQRLYSAEDLTAVIGRTLDYMKKDLDGITVQHRIRNLAVGIIRPEFAALPGLCRLSDDTVEVSKACEGISPGDLFRHLFRL